MSATSSLDAVIVGSGPNGLSAAITLALAGRSVRVYEAQPVVGGGTRSAALTTPGFVHDVCATVHALAAVSPFLKTLPLDRHGFSLVQPDAPFAHPLDDGTAVVIERDIALTAQGLSGGDARAYRTLFEPLTARADDLMASVLGPPGLAHPGLMARFGLNALRSAIGLARSRFSEERTRAMLAGVAAHSTMTLEHAASAAVLLVLGVTAHAVGWPFARGGSQRLADALAAYLRSLGGEIVTGSQVESLDDLPPARAVLCDTSPRQWLRLAGRRVPAEYRRRLGRFRYGPGVFKVDWALHAPVPWRAAACRRAGHGSRGGLTGGDCGIRASGVGGTCPRASIRAGDAAQPLGRIACASGEAHPVGVLPCAKRRHRRHDRTD